MTELAEELKDILTDDYQSRPTLCDKLNCKDRKLRDAVRELRDHGYNIAGNSDSDTKGYKYGDEEDKERTIKDLRARAAALEHTANALEKGVDIGQMEVAL